MQKAHQLRPSAATKRLKRPFKQSAASCRMPVFELWIARMMFAPNCHASRRTADVLFCRERSPKVEVRKVGLDIGFATLKGSSTAVNSQRLACNSGVSKSRIMEASEGIVCCGNGAAEKVIDNAFVREPDDPWSVSVAFDGDTIRAMTSHSFFDHSRRQGSSSGCLAKNGRNSLSSVMVTKLNRIR
ncbi:MULTISPECIES: hypothetical protein [Ruegeria]|uniref:Uncharacterized protein n=1 Tax=Ruegeria conchae TaxID=981384 RepID=A0A497YT47_9RHOB|nr:MULTISPECIES: hypothetical protein [Ruegeria]NOD37035.1 hypothetical protein [Ruegeria sp. HKCCD7296]NOE44169.1 hypothetical protein [Ruegeria sp. HKCCD7319]RLJ97594.1 hypothetical protein CLV75_4391 [Ruegeria conchae]